MLLNNLVPTINGVWCTDEQVFKHEAQKFFKKLFVSNEPCDPTSLYLHNVPRIDDAMVNSLLHTVTPLEVKEALFSMHAYKAPGPDRFRPIFFKIFWDTVGNDVYALVANSFASCSIPESIAATLIVPIPKVDVPMTMSDFRPISLCNVLLKIISKVLVHRIRPYLDSFISPFQSSFIPNRGTSDNAIIAQEVVHQMYKKKGKGGFLLFKIDFEKAYDRVDWNFLRLTLSDFGFLAPTIDLIMSCITSSSLSLTWNNEILESFNPNRGLRQGDPMSPYLFVLCMEKLGLLIQERVNQKKWLPIKIAKNGPPISHLFFADDCLLFTQAKTSQVRIVKEVLEEFCQASGLKVSMSKSRFLPSNNITRTKVAKFASITGFAHTYKLEKYLGFPMLSGLVRNDDFDYILDRINGRLAGWKGKLLNRAGRVTLANFVLSAIPVYAMQNMWLPSGTCDKIDSSIRRFIWGGNSNHWVSWPKLTRPKSHGGLGVKRSRDCNVALLGKHVWDIIHNPGKLWVQVLTNKYLTDTHILNVGQHRGSTFIWTSIFKALQILKGGYRVRVGKGEVSLWYDLWLNNDYLCDLVPYVDIQDIHLQVIKDIHVNGVWYFDMLRTPIPPQVRQINDGLLCRW